MFKYNPHRSQKKWIISLFVFSILSVGSLPAGEPLWIFNNGPDAKLISLGQGELCHEVGLTKLIPSGTDLTLTLPMGADDAFAATERPFFAVRYKYRTDIKQAGLFFTTDTLTTLSDKSYSAFPVIGDNTWQIAIVDMRTFSHNNWTGIITSFRFDPTNPSNTESSYQVSRLGFFPSEGEAQSFLDAAVDAPDYSQPTKFAASLQRVVVPGGCLFDGYDRADFQLQSTIIDTPSETTVVKFRQKGNTGNEVVIPLCDTNRRGFTRFIAREPGEYRLVDRMQPLEDISDQAPEIQVAIRFVVARKLLDEVAEHQFRPNAPVTEATWFKAIEALGVYGIDMKAQATPATRALASVVLKVAIQSP